MSNYYVEETRQDGKPISWAVKKSNPGFSDNAIFHTFSSFEKAKETCDKWNQPKPVITYHKVYP